MPTLHAKSHCCKANIWCRGGRRRSCSRCGRTWRIRTCKRGRKPRRVNKPMLEQALMTRQSLLGLAQRRRQSIDVVRYRFRRALHSLAEQPQPLRLRAGGLILVGDGLWFRFAKKKWTLYLLALRPVRGRWATFVAPILLPGKENASGWQQAISTIPSQPLGRVKALVSDGFGGVKGIVHSQGWVLQRCHFHLIRSVHVLRGRRRRLRGAALREEAYQLVRQALVLKDCAQLRALTDQLQALAAAADCPRRLRLTVRGFVRELPSFRAYLDHPELNLPTTTNAVESMGSIMRATVARVRTPQALERWAKALVQLRPRITCNGANPAPN